MINYEPSMVNKLKFNIGQPHLFRTCDKVAFSNTIENGNLWFRTDEYFRKVESESPQGRKDDKEGVNSISIFGQHGFFTVQPGGPNAKGELGRMLDKHYILSLHAGNVNYERLKKEFNANYTFGLKDSRILLYQIIAHITNLGYRCEIFIDQIHYYHETSKYGLYLDSSQEDESFPPQKVFTIEPWKMEHFAKRPQYAWQDEWRIILKVKELDKEEYVYINSDEKLIVPVSTDCFSLFPNNSMQAASLD